MLKWFEECGKEQDVIVASRIRLLRNLKSYPFPIRMSEDEGKDLINLLQKELSDIGNVVGRQFEGCTMDGFSPVHRMALKERQVLNQAAMDHDGSMGLMISDDESISLIFNADDHIRLQVSKAGLNLTEAWKEINKVDDFINEHFEYAFDEKLGYMTTYPTNLGTGMRAYLILHLPLLSTSSKFRNIVNEMGRYGVTMKPAFNETGENYGALYVLYNQKTLGQSEEDIIQVLTKVALQLATQERTVRSHSITKHRIDVEDGIYKAYGVLKYAKTLSLKDAMAYLSRLRWGVESNLIKLSQPCNCYKLMLGVLPSNLQVNCDRPMEGDMLNRARADYIRKYLPEINNNNEE